MIDQRAWAEEIERFHTSSPGATAKILRAATCRGRSPYEWLVDGLVGADTVVDLGCGDGPLAPLISGRWVGVDRSSSELRAVGVTSGSLVQGNFEHLPFVERSVGTVLCSMSLMLAEDPGAAVAEIRRVLRPGGTLGLLLPSAKPLTIRDRLRYQRLQRVLGLDSYFPSAPLLDAPASLLRQFGFAVVSDERARFSFAVASDDHAALLIQSLYLPGVDADHRQRARDVAQTWRGSTLGIPLCRIVATSPVAVGDGG